MPVSALSPVKVFFDGGCRPNPGPIEIAVVCGGHEHVRQGIGPGAAMDAEWLALIEALTLARTTGLANFVLLGDALAVIRQAQGKVRCPPPLLHHYQVFQALSAGHAPLRIRHIGRAQNLAGIALARFHPR